MFPIRAASAPNCLIGGRGMLEAANNLCFGLKLCFIYYKEWKVMLSFIFIIIIRRQKEGFIVPTWILIQKQTIDSFVFLISSTVSSTHTHVKENCIRPFHSSINRETRNNQPRIQHSRMSSIFYGTSVNIHEQSLFEHTSYRSIGLPSAASKVSVNSLLPTESRQKQYPPLLGDQ